MLIVDCITFFNEIDLLEVRFAELDPVVDKFVIVEAGQTFNGSSKNFFFDRYKEKFAQYDHKIVYIKLPHLLPLLEDTEANRFKLESFTRNAILYGLVQLDLDNDDLVMISDVDEIPSRESVIRLRDQVIIETSYISWTFKQFFQKCYFDEDLDDGYNRQWWGGTVAVKYKIFADYLPQQVRRAIGGGGRNFDNKFCDKINSGIVEKGGWHLSSFGGLSVREYKLANYAHGVNRSHNSEGEVIMVQENVADLLNGDEDVRLKILTLINSELNDYIPYLVKQNPIQFKHFFKCSYIGI